MFGIRHGASSPDTKKLIAILERHGVRYVLGGSVAASVWGLQVDTPGDLDIIPQVALDNLSRLAIALGEMEARPLGPFGHWTVIANGEFRWVTHPTTEEELDQWRPNTKDLLSFDHLFTTKHGNFDVVPEIAGTFDVLNERAIAREVGSIVLRVCHVDDLLARITIPRREKDIPRVAVLRSIQREYAMRGSN
jgi:hypothetical protein